MAIGIFWILKRMAPMRQIEAPETIVALNRYAINYSKSLLAMTPQAQLIDAQKPKVLKELTDTQIALIEREPANLDREFKMVEQVLRNRPSRFGPGEGISG